ncbi:hypothetical protein SH528x_002465 [Novipirellula sp. SH528]
MPFTQGLADLLKLTLSEAANTFATHAKVKAVHALKQKKRLCDHVTQSLS